MAIVASSVVSLLKAALDAEGSDYYTFDNDYKFAINYSLDQIVRIINAKYGFTKFPEEVLKELIKVRLYRTSKRSRITIADTVWGIVSIHPEAEYDVMTGGVPTPSAVANLYESSLITNCAYYKSKYDAKRLTAEEWEETEENPFSSGYDITAENGIKEYAWMETEDYGLGSSDAAYPTSYQLMIKPILDQKYVGVRYIKMPDRVTTTSSVIEFPSSVLNFIVSYALVFIAIKQGDHTNVYGIGNEQIDAQLMSII